MEQLLHYAWKHKMFPLAGLTTADGREVEVIDPGLHNRNAGPDFFNAKVKLGGTLWVGNVEIHDRASDWFRHGHDRDRAYANVVLHVAGELDALATDHAGRPLPQVKLEVPPSVVANYQSLLTTDSYPPCYKVVPQLQRITVRSWMAALQTERLERKTRDIARRAEAKDGSWEDAYFVTLARNYGFGINSEAFEQWALNVPLSQVAHHRDDLFQVEAIFMGQAGLLSPEATKAQALGEEYWRKLSAEYAYMQRKFGMQPMDCKQWRFLRLRPQNFPHIRISQLANLYHEHRAGLSVLLECDTLDKLRDILRTHVSPYWETHYTFGAESARNAKSLSPFSLNLLIINTAIPMLFAYGRHTSDERLCDRAFEFLESLKAENNHVIRMWRGCGLEVLTAGDSQALLQLKNEYCDRRDCLRCRFGYEYLKKSDLRN